MSLKSVITGNIERVQEQIAVAAHSVRRDPSSVRLVVVTKGHPLEYARAALEAGALDLGENYIEEGVSKILACTDYPQARWHMIGHLQSRKAKEAAVHFSYLHSLDSVKLANRLDRFAGEAGRVLPVLMECNVSGEQSKSGFPAWDDAHWADFLPEVAEILQLPNLRLQGLMTMAPFFDEPEKARPYFQRLSRIRQYLARQFPAVDWSELSMGMSGDFQVAIQEGATIVRIGTAILGPRPKR